MLMVTVEHEAFSKWLQAGPAEVAEVLRVHFGQKVPEFGYAQVASAEFNDIAPKERRVDTLVCLMAEGSPTNARPVKAVIVEVQRGRDQDKPFDWPAQIASARERHRCPVTLLVYCPDPALAAWCARPIDMGHPGWLLRPLVLTPKDIPPVFDPEAPAELVILSAIAHPGQAGTKEGIEALAVALSTISQIDGQRATNYHDIIFAVLSEAAWKELEMVMTGKNHLMSDWARGHFAKGEAAGEARAILAILGARDISVTESTRDRIAACSDLDQLDRWLQVAALATSGEEFETALDV
jgi:hypothetical protein